ncbi:MAG: DNA helicase RecQ [Beijerinckiaceae bacterium]
MPPSAVTNGADRIIDTPAHKILHDVFGYRAFRPGQAEIVAMLAGGRNALVVMPTGAGKSLCYQIPALLNGRLTIVVSPLVALMDDQTAALRANGVATACIHSGMTREDQVQNWREAAAGRAPLLYLSPERLMTPRMLEALEKLDPAMFVVDEAHCISKWGVSFRPEYEQLQALRDRFPRAVIAGFTATADAATRSDIAEKLFRSDGEIVVHGFDRPNLRLAVAMKTNWKTQLLAFLADKKNVSGIVYCLSRRLTEEAAEFLAENGFNAIAYHAGMDAGVRRANQNRFMNEPAAVMAATIAFGMGIDKPDIRYVCHLNLPGSMEAYYQEIGRAGRDGEPAETLLLYGMGDVRQRRMFIDDENSGDDHKMREHRRLDALVAFCDAPSCRKVALLSYFSESAQPCGNCDNCANPAETADRTAEAQILFATIRDSGQFFGAAHVTDIVCGADTQKIRDRKHDALASYGKGKDHPKAFWLAMIRQAVSGNFLTLDIQKFGALQLGEKARAVLEGDTAFDFREARPAKSSRAAKAAAVAAAMSEADAQLLTALKQQRMALARGRGVPPYVIFHDTVLQEMARKRPVTLDDMSAINGVGPKKLDDYGDVFLAAIAEAEAG